jgi:hypothetical protein
MSIEWRKVCIAAILADGKVDEGEVKMLQKELKASTGGIHPEGMTFLIDLREAATKKAKAKKEQLTEVFEKYFFKTVTDYILKDGKISSHEADWLRQTLFADKKIDDREWKFLQTVYKKAKEKSPEFEQLYKDCEATHQKAAAKK